MMGNVAVLAAVCFLVWYCHRTKISRLTEAHIRELQEMEAQNREEKKRIYEQISHEIRMPISIAEGYSQLIERGMVTDSRERDQYIGRICEQITYLDICLKSIMAGRERESSRTVWNDRKMGGAREGWDRGEAGEKRELDMAQFLGSMLPDMRCAADGKGVSIYLELCAAPVRIAADPLQLKKIFYNLLENSIRCTPSGGRITIAVSEGEDGCGRVVWKDNGIGMRPEEVRHIFEYGYQGSNSKGGSGLGLYMVKMLLEYQQANICARSLPGCGMAFYICFGQDL